MHESLLLTIHAPSRTVLASAGFNTRPAHYPLSKQKQNLPVTYVTKTELDEKRWNCSSVIRTPKGCRSVSSVDSRINEFFRQYRRQARQEPLKVAVSKVQPDSFAYQIRQEGNNTALVERLLQQRTIWHRAPTQCKHDPEVKMIWGYVPPQQVTKLTREQMISRIPCSNQLTDKGNLHQNITQYCAKNKVSDSKFLPITFCFKQSETKSVLRRQLLDFCKLFEHIRLNTSLTNTWIFKPTNLNQGRQIRLFHNLEQLKDIWEPKTRHPSPEKIRLRRVLIEGSLLEDDIDLESRQYSRRKVVEIIIPHPQTSKSISVKEENHSRDVKWRIRDKNSLRAQQETVDRSEDCEREREDLLKRLEKYLSHNSSIILQKYIENPLLIDGRKFDIRMWVLVDPLGRFYLYDQGYLRFSSELYRLDSTSIQNNFVHLTNHALQKHSEHYAKDRNLRRMETLKEHLKSRGKEHCYGEIFKEMARIVKISVQATLTRSRREETRCKCFEIFGYDFLLDRQLNVRLLEVNCNPAITQDCSFLKQLISKMLNDTFKLTVDKHFKCSCSRSYYADWLSTDNLWNELGRIGDTDIEQLHR